MLRARNEIVQQMRDIGREAARTWLTANYDAVGQKDTLDLRAAFS